MDRETKDCRVTVRIDETTMDILDYLSSKTKKSRSEVMREALRQYYMKGMYRRSGEKKRKT